MSARRGANPKVSYVLSQKRLNCSYTKASLKNQDQYKGQNYMRRLLTIVCCLLVLVGISLLSLVSCSEPTAPAPTPLGEISTTLNQDGISGRNFFQASWSLEQKTPEEVESLRELAWIIKDEVRSDFDTPVLIYEHNHRLILETTVDFSDPSEIGGILAIIYGRGHGRPDISIEVREPRITELKTSWLVSMTVNPGQVSPVKNFKWKVNMPAPIKDIEVIPSDAVIHQSQLGTNTVELTFEPQDRSVTVSITAEESRARQRVIWPMITGIVSGVVVFIVTYIVPRVRARRQRVS